MLAKSSKIGLPKYFKTEWVEFCFLRKKKKQQTKTILQLTVFWKHDKILEKNIFPTYLSVF